MKDDPTPVLVTDGMVSQAEWWIEQIWMRAEHPAPIPDPLNPKRSHKLVIFPDAAGGRGAPRHRIRCGGLDLAPNLRMSLLAGSHQIMPLS